MINTGIFSRIAEGLFEDSCNIYEYKSMVNDEGITVSERILKAENVPCRISFVISYSSIQGAECTGTLTEAKQRAKVFLPKNVDIVEGCEFEICHKGEVINYVLAGVPRVYGSHIEVIVNYGGEYC